MNIMKNSPQEHLSRQRDYVKTRQLDSQRAVASNSAATGLVDEKMLAESMRSVRYADEAHAAGDIIDNAIEAGASQAHVVFKTEREAIKEIAFIDDASGIDESFLPHATKWGGSSNDGTRNIFGRFGFGLPSASVNRGRKFSVYSRVSGDQGFNVVTVDLDDLGMQGNVVPLPTVRKENLPSWIQAYLGEGTPFTGGIDEVRTVVIWSKLDRLKWPNRQQSMNFFKQHLGITYSGWLDVCKMFVAGEAVEPVDVLFTTPDYRYFDIEGYPKADSQSPVRFEVPDANGTKHTVTVRFSLLTWAAYKAELGSGGKGRPARVRERIRTEYNGFFVTRNGRFIELVKGGGITWSSYARQVGMSIDFPPELDELFGVTPDKQTIIFTERVESLLESHGVIRAYRALYKLVEDERARLKHERDTEATGGEDRPSEQAIAKVVARDVKSVRKASKETQTEAERNLKEKVKELAKESGVPEAQVEAAQKKVLAEKPYKVEFSAEAEDDPFYTPKMVGTQLILRVNTAHQWYRELYSRLRDDQADLRSGLELMLWVLATSEIDSSSDARMFYRDERREWSRRLANAFDLHPLIFNKVNTKEELADEDMTPWAEDDELQESEAS
ncbi:ATP-binding protein [Leifsonia aquatica]|uniref:ATP-binding protein n=1 Tax=Leifsonia aquatica TaxID=144185 RepID=UPI0028A7C7F5|nr:ATP-binding protein [Leifsonia aquatica]